MSAALEMLQEAGKAEIREPMFLFWDFRHKSSASSLVGLKAEASFATTQALLAVEH